MLRMSLFYPSGFSSELFEDSTVSRFLREVETRLSHMNQAFEEEKVII